MCERRARAAVVVAVVAGLCGGCSGGGDEGGGASADTTAPTVPGALTVVAASTSRVDLTWSASSDDVGVAGYHVQRDGVRVASPAGTSWSDTGRTASTRYCYTVKAHDAAGNVSAATEAQCATTGAPPAAFPGFDLALAEGTFWKFAWDYSSTTGAQGSGSSTVNATGHLYVRLGALTTTASGPAYPVQLYGRTKLYDDPITTVVAPRWRWLSGEAGKLIGSRNGSTPETVYDLATGHWSGGGFFAEFPADTLIQASSGSLSNAWVSTTAVVAQRSSSQSQCEIIAGIRICGDSSYSATDRDYYKAGVGPLGYYYDRSYNDCGGGFCSWGSWKRRVGLVASSFEGDTFAPVAEVEPNDSPQQAQLASSALVVGDVAASDPRTELTVSIPTSTRMPVHDFYAFDHAGGTAEITLSFESGALADLDLLVFGPAGTLVAYSVADNVQSGDRHEQITRTLAAGRYVVGVCGYAAPSRATYHLQWE